MHTFIGLPVVTYVYLTRPFYVCLYQMMGLVRNAFYLCYKLGRMQEICFKKTKQAFYRLYFMHVCCCYIFIILCHTDEDEFIVLYGLV